MPASKPASSAAAIERSVLDWLGGQQPAMLSLLETLVNIDSGSADKAGVDAVGAHIRYFLDQAGIASTVIPDATYGDAISASAGSGAERSVLLLGHRDTVFPKGEAKRRRFRIADGRAYGPGVADMKSGLVMNGFVLAALARFGGPPAMALFTGDEEIASPFSRHVIEQHARDARAVFNPEPGRNAGSVVTGRKGGLFMRFTITGKAAHSASFENGISAIVELAHKTLALHALSDLTKGITLNVGIVAGGQSVNTVAPSAHGECDLRFVTPADRDAMLARVEALMATAHVAGTKTTLEITGEFAPLVETDAGRALYTHYAACLTEQGFAPSALFTGGCADSGVASATGTPTICGLGPVGGRAHTAEEYMEVDTLLPRTRALALAILRLP